MNIHARLSSFVLRVRTADHKIFQLKEDSPHHAGHGNQFRGVEYDQWITFVQDAMKATKADHVEEDPYVSYYEFTFLEDPNIDMLPDMDEAKKKCIAFIEKHFVEKGD